MDRRKASRFGLCNVIVWAGWVLSLLGAASCACAFNALVAFGDSYTDTGNSPSSLPDYWNSRFSNGPLWIEYLCATLGFSYQASINYSVSGSESDELGVQINNFPGTSDSANVLFSIWSGNNDFENHLSTLGTNNSAWETRISQTLSSLMTASGLIYQKGARKLLLFNQLDITLLPGVRNVYGPFYRAYFQSKVQTFNSRLSSAIPGLINTHPGLQVYLLDIYSDVSYLVNNYSASGFTKANPGALNDPALTDKSFTGPGANYVFWDEDHPTTKTHQLIAGWAAGVLPAPAPPPTIILTSPQNGAKVAAPASIQLSANVDAGSWSISQVAFYENGAYIGAVSNAPYSLTWPGVPAGNYLITAQVGYGSGHTVMSGGTQISVIVPPVLGIGRPTNGLIRISASGAIGNSYLFLASTNLKTWAAFSTNVNTTGSVQVVDVFTNLTRSKFYRVSVSQ